ncbi:radical SAM protein [Candidatus Woesearchaeota archaeon]|nr:radical SAM protein [Candidatus Woesearchaeota archaeon]
MAEIILVQPEVGDMDSVRSAPSIPASLLHAATLVSREFDVKLIDQRLDKMWKKSLAKELAKKPLCVGVTAMTGMQIKHALEISRFVKEKKGDANVPVIWGGVHASLLPEQTLKNKFIDIVVKGEGEESFLELARALKDNKPLEGIHGVWYKKNNKICGNTDRAFLDLDKLPDIPYHLVNVSDYLQLYDNRKSLAIQTSRGCPNQCTYCYNVVYNKRRWRGLSSGTVIERIKLAVKEFGVEDVYLLDDNFFIDMKRAKAIAQGLKRLGITWQAQGVTVESIDVMSNDYLKLLEQSGLRRVTLGIESGSPRIRRLIGKNDDVDKIIRVNKRLRGQNIIVFCSFITGFPTETREDLQKTISLIFSLLKDNPNMRNSPVYNFIPYPGTKMAELAKKHGFKEPVSLEQWADFAYSNSNVPYIGSIASKKELESLYFSSIFIDDKFREYTSSGLIRILARLYRPFARFRVRNLFFKFMIEEKIKRLIAG